MRKQFANDLYELMKTDKNIVLITADLGYGFFDIIRENMPDQFYNVGAAEQVAMDIAVGLALCGRRPVVYTITPFLYRTWETLRTYVDHEVIPILIVGAGRAMDYKTEGFSHHAVDDEMFKVFKNIEYYAPTENLDLQGVLYKRKPVYLNLQR